MNFEKSKELLDLLGWRYSATETRFTQVWLPLTPEDWCALCMREEAGYLSNRKDEDGDAVYRASEYMGGCCGSMSYVQDQLNGWFRDGGYVSAQEFVELGKAMRDHNCGGESESYESVDAILKSPYVLDAILRIENRDLLPLLIQKVHKEVHRTDAWIKLALLYQLIGEDYAPKAPKAQFIKRSELQAAFHTVANFSYVFGLRDFMDSEHTPRTKKNAQLIMMMAKFLPALRIVHERAHELCPEPIKGWALIDLSVGEGEVAETMTGPCIFATKTEADTMVRIQREYDEEEEKETSRRAQLKVRPVSLSLEKGLEFLDDGEAPSLRAFWPWPHWVTEPVEDIHMLWEQYAKYRQFGEDVTEGGAQREAFVAGAQFFRSLQK